MNNKGFAITGILYTLLILFLLIFASFLGELRTRNRFLEKSIESFEDSYIGIKKNDGIENDLAKYTGKYEFKDTANGTTCYSYLKKGTIINTKELKYTTETCNSTSETDKSNFIFSTVYVFEGSE